MKRFNQMSQLVSEKRDLSGFSRISLSDIGHLMIEPGDQESVIVETEVDTLPWIITKVNDGTLRIRLKRRAFWPLFRPVGKINYYVTVKELDGVHVSGAGTVTGSRLCAEHMDLHISGTAKARLEVAVDELDSSISGAGSLRLAGEATRQKLTISGAGKYLAKELSSREGLITISGTGVAAVDVQDKLDVTIGGCGHVEYRGDPEFREQISGVGRVRKSKD
jgi:hypothetical protein